MYFENILIHPKMIYF